MPCNSLDPNHLFTDVTDYHNLKNKYKNVIMQFTFTDA